MAATPTNNDRGTSYAISHCISLPVAGEGSTEASERERGGGRGSSLGGGVKVLDNCSTKCACWALWMQSGEVTGTYLCYKWMRNRSQFSRNLSRPSIIEVRENSMHSPHPCIRKGQQMNCNNLLPGLCIGLWVFFKCSLRHDGPPEVRNVTSF